MGQSSFGLIAIGREPSKKILIKASNEELLAPRCAIACCWKVVLYCYTTAAVIPWPVNMTQYNWSLQAAASQVIIGPCYRNTHPANFLLRSRILLNENMKNWNQLSIFRRLRLLYDLSLRMSSERFLPDLVKWWYWWSITSTYFIWTSSR